MLRTLFELLAWHYASGNMLHVEAVIHSILRTVPDDVISLQFLGLVYYRTGRIDDATRVFRAAAPQPSPLDELVSEGSDSLLSRNGHSAAAACCLAATCHNPDLAMAWHDLGLALHDVGLPEQGVRAQQLARLAQRETPDPAQASPAGTTAACGCRPEAADDED
jgi:tetratricopeptide (TPR) repeat protein